jgi:hypothetical protein
MSHTHTHTHTHTHVVHHQMGRCGATVQIKPGVVVSVKCCVTSEQTADLLEFQTGTIQNSPARPGGHQRVMWSLGACLERHTFQKGR